jgi:hypothetical protein
MKTMMNRATCLMGALAVAASFAAGAQSMKIVNTYKDKEVWITTYQSGQQLQSFCVEKGATKVMSHVQYYNGFKVRAEVMTGPACKGAKVCDTDMGVDSKQTTGYKDPGGGIYIHQHASIPDKCYISWTSAVDAHKMVFRNTYKDRYVWVTSYDYQSSSMGQKKIFNSTCVDPGAEKTVNDDRYAYGHYVVRAEVMMGAGCKGTKVCDTDMNPMNTKPVSVRQNATDPNKCFLEAK